jgi:hypothetical protein
VARNYRAGAFSLLLLVRNDCSLDKFARVVCYYASAIHTDSSLDVLRGVTVNLYTDTACKNQVGHLDGTYGAVCQMTLGTAAISFMVVNIGSGCLGTVFCPAILCLKANMNLLY